MLEKLTKAGLKLNPGKCHFFRQSVEYLGYLITPQGLKPNPRQVSAVLEFPVPKSVTKVHQFLGLTSYYWCFISQFAAPLHHLNRKGVEFMWMDNCQVVFDTLKAKLTQAPILAYPDFDQQFVLETNASVPTAPGFIC